jgi:putative ABC transport system permease protein
MEVGPIWRAITRNKSSYVLIALQIAVTMALMVNAIAIIQERTRMMDRPTGIDEDNLFTFNSTGFDPDMDFQALVAEDLDAMRQLPGVRNAMMTNSTPIRNGGWGQNFQTEPGEDKDSVGTGIYFTDETGVDTFGVNLVAGRNFEAIEVAWFDPESDRAWPEIAIVSAELATSLFPDTPLQDIVGKTIYISNYEAVNIVGIVERLQASWPGWQYIENASLVPMKRGDTSARYVVRTDPGYRDEVISQVESMLAESYQGRLIRNTTTMQEIRKAAYASDLAMIKLLVFIVSLLTAITSLGIVGLASFNVARRTKQIGTRRALGATRPAILRYFMLENFLISTVGVTIGAVLGVGVNMLLVQMFNLTPIAWYMIPSAMLALWLVGQLAVYGPARRASNVSPAIATRTV